MKFTAEEIAKRTVATFVQAATGALIAAGLLGQDAATAAVFAGVTAVITFAHRLSSRWLEQRASVETVS